MKKQVLITSPKGAGMSRHLKPVKRGRQTRAQFTERLLACDPKGQRLYAAQEREIRVFEIRREETDGPRLVQERALKAPGAVSDITCQGHDTIVAIEEKDSAALYQLRGERFAPLARLPAAPREVVATEAGLAVLLPPQPGRMAEILHIDARSGDVLARADTSSDTTALRPASGAAVLAVDPRRRTVNRVDLDPRCDPQPPRPRPPRPDETENDGEPCYKPLCACCSPRDPIPPVRRPGTDALPPRRPPRDTCEDGSDGTQDDCFIYVAAGSSIVYRDICRPERGPCLRNLHRIVERIEHLGQTLYAVTRQGSAVTVLDARSLNTIEERGLAGPGSLILRAPAVGQILAFAPDLSELVIMQASQTALNLDFDLEAEVSEKLITGTDSLVPPLGPQFAPVPTSILIVPVVYAAQNYAPAGSVSTYRDALWTLLGTEPDNENAPIQKILNFYNEQSDSMQPVSFTVFGEESSDFYTGGPIQIDQSVQSYYYGDFKPGGMQRLLLHGTPSATIAFRGNETRDITAISAVNANADDNANHFPFTLRFPAAIVRLNLDATSRVRISTSGPDWPLLYDDSSGGTGNLTLEPSNLSATYDRTFEAAGAPFDAEVSGLQSALDEMLAASTAAGDFSAIDVVWGKRPGEARGRLYILFRFAGGGSVPRFTSLATNAQIASFFDMNEDDVGQWRGSVVLDTTLSADDQEDRERRFSNYLKLVSRLAEIEANATSNESTVADPKLGSAQFSYGNFDGNVGHVTEIRLDDTHGGAEASIVPGGGSGADPLDLANANALPGTDFEADVENTMRDKDAFFEMVYANIIEAVNDEHGGPPPSGWTGLKEYLEGFTNVYTFPVDAPPPGTAGAWSVDAPGSTGALRAFVRSRDTTNAPDGMGEAGYIRWAMNFQSFDPTVGDGISPRESDTRTFGHEIGHTLELVDVYSSSKFDPTIQYMEELDLMGSSQAEWSHLCAYHKLALGWWQVGDQVALTQPAEDTVRNNAFILVPTEWWGRVSESDARAAIPGAVNTDPVTGVALLDLNGDGGVLGAIEARAPGERFSGDMAPDGSPGRVMVTNILDYGEQGRYGQVIEDTEGVAQPVIDGLLRYRRRIHPLAKNLQEGDEFDFEGAPGFPYDGVVLRVLEEGSTSVDGISVPIYHCTVEWTGRRNPDVGFADHEVDWQSSDIAIDYIGGDPNNPESGPDMWPTGQPQGVGNKVIIPPEGSPDEPHRVLLRIHNFGEETVEDVRYEVFLKDPGGGGDLGNGEPYASGTIDELGPSDQFDAALEEITWNVPSGQEPHVCWRAEIRDFRVGSGASSQVIVTDASPTNNWAQQNIFERDVVYASPPEPFESRFSVTNDGPFAERAHLVAEGLPRGARLRVRPERLRVPPFSQRNFQLRFEFDEDMIDDPCRREMDVLLRCIRTEEHNEEPWGASLFRLRLKRKTELTVGGTWYGSMLNLSGQISPGIGLGNVSILLDFRNDEQPTWLSAPLQPGGGFDASLDTTDISHDDEVFVMARYRGTPVFAASTSPTVRIPRPPPAG